MWHFSIKSVKNNKCFPLIQVRSPFVNLIENISDIVMFKTTIAYFLCTYIHAHSLVPLSSENHFVQRKQIFQILILSVKKWNTNLLYLG